MSYASSEFTRGTTNSDFSPHYLVELDSSSLSLAEIPNSICLLDHYDHLLMFYECQLNRGTSLPVPMFDIIVVLMTLATISERTSEHILRNNDPYNTTRASLSKRAIKLLRFYVEKLKEFDCSKYPRYSLELLRCQFFIVMDQLFLNTDIKNPYKSYLSCLEQKSTVLGNELVTTVFRKKGKFLNAMLWTLDNSLQDDYALYVSSHDVWMPIIDLIIETIELRHDYFIRNEIKNDGEKLAILQALSNSPLVRFLSSIDCTKQFSSRFCGYLFIMCDYKSNLKNTEHLQINPVYNNETVSSEAFIQRVAYSANYKLKRCFLMQRKFLKTCFRLYLDVPTGHELTSPAVSLENLLNEISKTLAELHDIKQFEAFFFTDSHQSLHMIPFIAQRTLAQIFSNFIDGCQTHRITLPGLRLVEKLDDADSFLSQCVFLFRMGLFLMWNEKSKKNFILESLKADICLFVLVDRLQYLNGKSALIDSQHYDTFVALINKNDSNRRALINRHFPREKNSKFHSAIVQLLNV